MPKDDVSEESEEASVYRGREGKAFLIPLNELPSKYDPRMSYLNHQIELGEQFYGTEAMKTNTFKDFKKNVIYRLALSYLFKTLLLFRLENTVSSQEKKNFI